MSFLLPKAVLEQHVILLGKTRSGKSSKLRLIVEHLLDQQKPVCIIDPKGDWWGLKSSADGRAAGYPVVIFGGEHADVPITRHSGAAVAELIATGNRPCIIDLGGWMVAERTEFFIAFASHLFKLTKGARYLVIDEVHNFCPKGKIMDPGAGKMLHWANRLASEGAGKGITLMAASQRPQKVHNDFLTSCETLIACRVIHKADRDAIKDWIDGNADAAIGREVLAGLAQMKRPEAWVWSPEAGFGPRLIEFPIFATYDSFRPQAADAGRLKGWASVDLDEVRGKLAAAVAEAEANDQAVLKKRIRELEHQWLTRIDIDPKGVQRDVSEAEQRGYKRGKEEAAERFVAAIMKRASETILGHVETWRGLTVKVLESMQAVEFALSPESLVSAFVPVFVVKDEKSKQMERIVAAIPVLRKPIKTTVNKFTPFTADGGGGELRQVAVAGLKQRLLNAIARLSAEGVEVSREAAGALAGAKASGGYCANMIGQLKTSGLIEYPTAGTLALTAEGAAIADPGAIKGSLADAWLSLLSGLERDILEVLIRYHPVPQTREEVAADLHKSMEGGYFSNMIGRLKTMGAVYYPKSGALALTRNVMP